MSGVSAKMGAHAVMPHPSHMQPEALSFGPSVVQVPDEGEYFAIVGPVPPCVADAWVGAYTAGQPPFIEAAVSALQWQKYRGNAWNARRVTGTAAAPAMLGNGLAEAHLARVMANIPRPKYSGNPEEWDECERTLNKSVSNTTMGCRDTQCQPFCLAMLPHSVPVNMKKALDELVVNGRISTRDGMWRTFRKEEVTYLPQYAKGRFKDVSLRTSECHIRPADSREFRQEYRHLRRYVQNWRKESEDTRD